MKQKKIRKRGKRHDTEYQGDAQGQHFDIADIRQLDNYYQHFDQYTKQSIRK